jgi:hypothetical protein
MFRKTISRSSKNVAQKSGKTFGAMELWNSNPTICVFRIVKRVSIDSRDSKKPQERERDRCARKSPRDLEIAPVKVMLLM